MPEVLDIRVDDNVELDGIEPDRPPARWRRALGVVILAILAITVAITVLGDSGSPPATSAEEAARPDRGETAAVAAAQAALNSWGEFGVTGDLAVVARLFDPAGPQYARFAKEVDSIKAKAAGAPAYVFAMDDPRLLPGSGTERVVRGSIVASRNGETDQHFAWDIVLRRNGTSGWVVWTVRESVRPQGPIAATPGRAS